VCGPAEHHLDEARRHWEPREVLPGAGPHATLFGQVTVLGATLFGQVTVLGATLFGQETISLVR